MAFTRKAVSYQASLDSAGDVGYAEKGLDIDQTTAVALAQIRNGLMHDGAALTDGSPVRDSRSAVAWLVEQFANSPAA